MPPAVKICGIRDASALDSAIRAGASYIGFIHYPASPRHVSFEEAARLRALAGNQVHPVSVTVNADDEVIAEIMARVRPDFLQLHGHETPERLRGVKQAHPGIRLIKALPVRSPNDIAQSRAYAGIADMLLFDAPPPPKAELPGGNGVAFDWNALKHAEIALPWFLSGGLTHENVEDAVRISGAKFVDVSSGVESAPGIKDEAKIRAFLEAAKIL